jgi:hypothetical protein
MRRVDRSGKGRRTKLFTIALILDFMSPLSTKVLHQPFPPIERIVLYPIRAEDPELPMPSCSHPLEKFMSTQGLKEWTGKLRNDEQAGRPLVAAFEKIRFDIKFGLHPINQAVVNVPDGDSCKKNICEEILKLDATLKEKGRKLELVEVSPLGCKIPKNSAIRVVPMDHASAAAIVNEVKNLAMKKPGEAEMSRLPKPVASPVASIEPAIIELKGPPVKVRFVQSEAGEGDSSNSPGDVPTSAKSKPRGSKSVTPPIVAQVPGTVKIPPGSWKVLMQSPSWTKETPGLQIDLKEREKRVFQVQSVFDDQLTWLESEKKRDQLLVFDLDGSTRRVLIPAGSPPIPMPKNIDWKIFPIPVPSPSHSP